MWLMDAISMTDGTVGGVGKLLAASLPNLSGEELPNWARNKTPAEMQYYMTKIVGEAYQVSVIVHEYVERERAKGRMINEIYEEIKPFLDEKMKEIQPDAEDDLLGGGDLFATEEDAEEEADPSYVAAAKEAQRAGAPHRRLGERTPDPRLDTSPFEVFGRLLQRGPIAAAVRAHPRASEIREPLMLVGSINKFNEEESREKFAFQFTGTRDPSFQESKLRIEIPADGLKFQIFSRKQGVKWRILPGTASNKLQDGDRHAVQANIHYDKDAAQLNKLIFVIEGSGMAGPADIWVAMNLESGVQVWFMDLA